MRTRENRWTTSRIGSIFNIPGDATGLPEGVKADARRRLASRAATSWEAPDSSGLAHLRDHRHHYTLELYALDTKLDLAAGASRDDVMKAMEGHVLTGAVYIGLFNRQPGSSMGPPPRQ